MKKLYTLLLVVVLTVMAVLPVMATTKKSPTATDVTPTTTTVSAKDVSVTQITDSAVKSMIDTFVGTASNLTALGVDAKAKMLTYMDISYTGTIPTGGIQLPMKITGAKAGDYVYVLHAVKSTSNANAWTWEVVGKGYLSADLTITATFKSFSPVVIMKVDAANANAATTNGNTAPKTGEF
ncbi:MAG: hypothetical protein MJ134_10070 [Lachnospiraceae bacterium]|nr:hypothetical protein [Lachnospiraceae bacterium]